jgi:hypothetical protein
LPFSCMPIAHNPWATSLNSRRFDRDKPALLTQ